MASHTETMEEMMTRYRQMMAARYINPSLLRTINDTRFHSHPNGGGGISQAAVDALLSLLTDATSNPFSRMEWVKEFGWVVPTMEFIRQLREFAGSPGSFVFPAAGLAFIPMLVANTSLLSNTDPQSLPDIVATDSKRYPTREWFPVPEEDGVETAQRTTTGDTLVISWAPHDEELGTEMLRAFQGDRLVVIGEGKGGCTASDSFFEELEANWVRDSAYGNDCIIKWSGIHDGVDFFRRRAGQGDSSKTSESE